MLQKIGVAGVGGQGSILVSHLLAAAAIKASMKVRVGETFGGAMRGGPVFSHVKIGEGESPLIGECEAELILSLEPLEGFRAAVRFLSEGGWLVSNTRPWYPLEVNVGYTQYPTINEIKVAISEIEGKCFFLDAIDLAVRAGNIKTMNVVMLGTMYSAFDLGIDEGFFREAIMDAVPPSTLKTNLKAFNLGVQYGELRFPKARS